MTSEGLQIQSRLVGEILCHPQSIARLSTTEPGDAVALVAFYFLVGSRLAGLGLFCSLLSVVELHAQWRGDCILDLCSIRTSITTSQKVHHQRMSTQITFLRNVMCPESRTKKISLLKNLLPTWKRLWHLFFFLPNFPRLRMNSKNRAKNPVHSWIGSLWFS